MNGSGTVDESVDRSQRLNRPADQPHAVGFVGGIRRLIENVGASEDGLSLLEAIGDGNASASLHQRRDDLAAKVSGATGNQDCGAGKLHQSLTPRPASVSRMAVKLVMVGISSAD